MTQPQLPEIGKISPEVFDHIIFPHLGKKDERVLVGPRNGVDTGIVDLGGGKVMVTTTDPVFIVPEYGFDRAAWFAVHILLSDAVTSGLKPDYISIDLNLPLKMKTEEFAQMWRTMDEEFTKMNIAVISGHTAKYAGVDYPMVGGATVICIGDKDKYVGPDFVTEGDDIIITKGAAIESTGLFVAGVPQIIEAALGKAFLKDTENIFWQMSVVEDALTAVSVGVRDNGVIMMHDATECGVWGGLFEIANSAGKGLRIDKEKIPVHPNVKKVCELFKIDPYCSISEGTLLIACKDHKSGKVIEKLKEKGITSAVIGKVMEKNYGIKVIENHKEKVLVHPVVDPFWQAFDTALKRAKMAS